MPIPNFFIVGTPKAGTTSLYYYLEEHPQVFMSRIKETNYFSYDEIKAQGLFYDEEKVSTLEQYQELFSDVENESALGEASVSYLFYKTVPNKLYKYNPSSNIIVVLRDPVKRGFSHYLMDSRLGLVNESYEDIVHTKVKGLKGELFYQQYVELGLYYNQIKRYLDTFGRKQVKVIFFEELLADLPKVIKEIYTFLNVDPDFQPALDKNYNSYKSPKNYLIDRLYKNKKLRNSLSNIFPQKLKEKLLNTFFKKEDKPTLSVDLENELINLYRDDIMKLENLLDVNLKSWYSK